MNGISPSPSLSLTPRRLLYVILVASTVLLLPWNLLNSPSQKTAIMSLTTEPRRNEETDDTGKYQASEQPVQQHITPVDPSMDRVCSALYALRQLVPAGSAIPRPFVFLGIDQNAAPFSPAADSAYPGSSMHREARRAVLDALGRMQATIAPAVARGDSGAEKVWVASVLVGYMLLDDAARALFLSTVDPKMKAGQGSWLFGLVGGGRGDEDAGVVCDEIWERMGWSRTSSSRRPGCYVGLSFGSSGDERHGVIR